MLLFSGQIRLSHKLRYSTEGAVSHNVLYYNQQLPIARYQVKFSVQLF